MSRSLKKGPFTDPKLLKKVKALKKGDESPIKTWSRASVITPEMGIKSPVLYIIKRAYTSIIIIEVKTHY